MKLYFTVPVVCKELQHEAQQAPSLFPECHYSKKNFSYVANLLKRRLCDSTNPIEHGICFVPSIEEQERAADIKEVV